MHRRCSHNSTVVVLRCLTRTLKFNLELTVFAKTLIREICYIFKLYNMFVLHVFGLYVICIVHSSLYT